MREQITARINDARRSLFMPAFIRAIGPLALWVAAFFVLWLSGLTADLPLRAKAAIGVIFYLGGAIGLWLAHRNWHRPTDPEAHELINEQVEGRPIDAWTDRPAGSNTTSWKLWEAHQHRMAKRTEGIRSFDLAKRWKKLDPVFLRYLVPVAVIGTAIYAGSQSGPRLSAGLATDVGALFGAHTLTVEAWAAPPAYTGAPPILLEVGSQAKIPEGSEVTIRVISPGQPSINYNGYNGDKDTARPERGVDEAFESKFVVTNAGRISVDFWGERAAFPLAVIEDIDPTVEMLTEPILGEGDKTEFEWTVSDDYGVTQLDLVAQLANPPKGAEELEEVIPVPMFGFEPLSEEGQFSQDLVKHRWAGLDVMLRLRATDASGAFSETEPVAFALPEKIFLQPLARSAQEIRATILREHRPYDPKPEEDNYALVAGTGLNAFADAEASRLERAPEGIQRANRMLEAITYDPVDYHLDPVIFMAFAHARGILEAATNKPEAEESETILWDIALRAEYGSVADAKSALEAARRALEQALKNGASEEEIKRLMDMYEQAVENYLAAQMAEALRNGNVTEQGGEEQRQAGSPGSNLGDDELQKMLDALRDLSETGASDQARQLLSEMSRMLEQFENAQIRLGQGSQGGGQQGQQGPLSRALNRALQETNRSLSNQRDLNDATEQAMRDGADARTMQELADRQRELRERLEQQMRSGGGDPRQPEQGQGQGQGQQGEGQGQQQAEGQGQGQGEGEGQGQQGSPTGSGGREGIEADGQFGQESERSRRLLSQALDAQRRSENALRNGDLEAAQQAQREAMSNLQQRSMELDRLADDADEIDQAEGDNVDPLGNTINGDGGFGDNVEVPDELERKRARDVLDEIRRRAGDRTLPQEEKSYLRRLLDRF